MRIGILTHPLRLNYGGLLQNYALQIILKRLGHTPITLDIPFKIEVNRKTFLLDVIKRIYRRYILHLPVYIFEEWRYNRLYPVMMQNLQPFIDKYIDKIEIKDFNKLQNEDFDVLLVGSDQVWRRKYMPDIYKEYLKFAETWNVKRISYAASFGTEEWEYSNEETIECKRLLQKFNAVSVREKSGVALCNSYFGIKAMWVLDPTMLLKREDYIALFKETSFKIDKGGLLTYFLDERPENAILTNIISKEKNLQPFCVNSKYEKLDSYPITECVQLSMEFWLRGYYNAEFIITDSFHACVFSILFNKPFVVFGNVKRGLSRFNSLLDMCGLQNRIITNIESYYQLSSKIDWKKVNIIIEQERVKSLSFLEHALQT